MKIAFYKAKHGNWQDWLIAAATFSKYSHCELVFSNGECASASPRDRGVRFKNIDLTNGHWDVYDLTIDVDEAQVRQWFVDNDCDQYDWPGAVLSLIKFYRVHPDKKFCSQCCAINLNLPPNTTPGRLYKTLKRLSMI